MQGAKKCSETYLSKVNQYCYNRETGAIFMYQLFVVLLSFPAVFRRHFTETRYTGRISPIGFKRVLNDIKNFE